MHDSDTPTHRYHVRCDSPRLAAYIARWDRTIEIQPLTEKDNEYAIAATGNIGDLLRSLVGVDVLKEEHLG